MPALARPRLALVRGARLEEADDSALARAAIEGHEGAPLAIWERFASLVRGVLRRTLGPGADVQDQTQETFIQFFKEVKNLRELSALRAFLLGIAVRVARSELRRRRIKRWLWLTDDGTLPDRASQGTDDDAREAIARLYALLDRIDDKSRLLFALRHIQGLELTDTAACLGISLATTKRRLTKVTARVHALAVRDPLLAGYLDATCGESARKEEYADG